MTPTSRRAIDLHDGDKIGEKALKTLIHAAVEVNKHVLSCPSAP